MPKRLSFLFPISCIILLAAGANAQTPYPVGVFSSSVFDQARSREIAYTIYYPQGFQDEAHVLLFSHGGIGSPTGHTTYGHLGSFWATQGFIAIHVNHLSSANIIVHVIDRPNDVSFVLDALQAETLPLPPLFLGTLETTEFGHSGHSFGAHTAMGLAGGDFGAYPSALDERIVAFAPISLAGTGQFGAFDNGPNDNSWVGIDVPMFNLVGEEEKDTNYTGTINVLDWRLMPFDTYSAVGDKFQTVLPDQDHMEMGEFPTPESEAYIAGNIALFFDVYLRQETANVCFLDTSPDFVGQQFSSKVDLVDLIAAPCPPPVGLPEPGTATSLLAGTLLLSCLSKRRKGCNAPARA
jgi:hypothetical protein